MKRTEHTFEFPATRISEAAHDEAEYHEQRLKYWQGEYEDAILIVENTISAKVVRRDITGGNTVDVAVDYGDQAAWQQAQRAFRKIATHREAAEQFRTDERVYGTQMGRIYELDIADVHHFRLGGNPREE